MKKLPSIEKNGLVIGLVTSLTLVMYFMLMKLLGLDQVLELRFFNLIILTSAVCYGINKLKKELHEEEFYLKGWAQGILISAVAAISFGVFMSFYISYFDAPLMLEVQRQMNIQTMNGVVVFMAIMMEGMASGVVITLCAMQYFKSPDDVKDHPFLKKGKISE